MGLISRSLFVLAFKSKHGMLGLPTTLFSHTLILNPNCSNSFAVAGVGVGVGFVCFSEAPRSVVSIFALLRTGVENDGLRDGVRVVNHME